MTSLTMCFLAAFALTPAERTKTIDDRYPDARPTRAEIRAHQEHGYVVSVRGVKSRAAADYYRSLGVERFTDADPALWSRPKNSIDRALDEIDRLDRATEEKWLSFATAAEADAYRRQLQASMTEAIGGFPARTPLNARTTGAFARTGCRIEKVLFESEPMHHVTGYLFLPDDPKFKPPYPAVLVPLGHADEGKLCPGYFKGGVVAARAGLAALVYDPIDQGERLQLTTGCGNCVAGHVNAGLRAQLVGWNLARFRIWDAMRGLDYLESRPEIDGTKLAVMGQSGGGTLTSYVAALDPRVKVSCPAGFVTTSRDLAAFWGPQDCEQNIPGAMVRGLNHLSLMLMMAPKPVSLILAEDDAFPIYGSCTTLEKMRAFYAKQGLADRVGFDLARGRMHGWYDCSREASVRWIRRWLTGDDAPAPHLTVDETSVPTGEEANVVPEGGVVRLPGERSVYDILRTRLGALEAKRPALTREAVARISGIDVGQPQDIPEDVDCVRNGYWSYIWSPADELACLYEWLGTSLVRVRAERMIAEARRYLKKTGRPMKLVAKGHAAVAAAHAYYLARDLFSGLEISDPPPSWREALCDPGLKLSPQDIVFGALAAYDWTDLLPAGTRLTVDLSNGENWWGVGGGWGSAMPFNANSRFAVDLRRDNGGHPIAPMLVSDRGRYIWCDGPIAVSVTNGVLRVLSDKDPIALKDGFGDLRGAFRAAAKAHFPASGKAPDARFFSAPQLNTWIELTYNQNQKDILAYVESMKRNGVPPGVLMIDDTWQYAYGTWEFDPRRFSDPKGMMDRLHREGYVVLLWTCPFVSMDSPAYRELADCGGLKGKGGFVMNADGVPFATRWWNGFSAMLDMTHPEGRAWFRRQLDRLQRDYGADGFKLDGGNFMHYILPGLLAHDATATPAEQSGAYGRFALEYPMSECRALYRLGGQPVVTRLGDKGHDWQELRRCVTDMLATSICGYPFVCPDMIGGGSWIIFTKYATTPFDEELFVRSAQVHALSPMMQFSASPWRMLSEKGQAAVRKAVETRQKFADRIVRLAEESGRTGEPMMRYMDYQFPGHGYAGVKDQFAMGDALIVAPQLVKGAAERTVEIPEGTWTADDGTQVVGPKRVRVKTPLDRLVYFTRNVTGVEDISADVSRQTVIAEGGRTLPEGYQGHPTTVLTREGKLLCVWTFGHGGPCGPAAESADGGRTWTRIDARFPAVYRETHKNCPTLQKCVRKDGGERLFVFSAKFKGDPNAPTNFFRLASMISDDGGRSWREGKVADVSSAMPPTGFMRLKDGTLALFGQVRLDATVKTDRPQDDQGVWMSISRDDGETWGPMRIVAAAKERNLCEPCCIRSPDGKTLALVMRENRHRDCSMMCFSSDEGQTWTAPVLTAPELSGDRHEALALEGGRYLICFRDRMIGASTYGQYVGWVGSWDDLVHAKPGEKRIRLLNHHGKKGVWPGNEIDTGYSGVERLPDGTILCTTYTKHFPDDRHSSVVATRLYPADIP